MMKPVYNTILRYSCENPAIIFVPTRKQAKLTAIDILTLASADRKPDLFKHAEKADIESFLQNIVDKVSVRPEFIGAHVAALRLLQFAPSFLK